METMTGAAPAERVCAFTGSARSGNRPPNGRPSSIAQPPYHGSPKNRRVLAGFFGGELGRDRPGRSGSVYFTQIQAVGTSPSPRRHENTASLVLAICGIAVFWLPWVNLICPALAIILGAADLVRAGTRKREGWFCAAASLVLGVALFLIGLLVIDIALSLTPVL